MGFWREWLNKWFKSPPPFKSGDDVLITLEKRALPIKLHTKVLTVGPSLAVIALPQGWWKLVNLDPGTSLCLTRMSPDGVFRIHGTVERIEGDEIAQLFVSLESQHARDQRRALFRLELQKPFQMQVIDDAGDLVSSQTATLTDLSAGGVGFYSQRFLVPGTRLETEDLLDTLVPEPEPKRHRLWVVWCRVARPHGFRIGASFDFECEREQDRMVRVMNLLQIKRMGHLIRQQEELA